MEKIDLNEYLASNEYPGRGIAVAKAPDGRQMFIGYFIMGRSENSRNRVFDPVPERGGICTMAAMAIAAEHLLKTRNNLEKILAENSGQSIKKVHADAERDNWMSAQETLEYGFIDEIMANNKLG